MLELAELMQKAEAFRPMVGMVVDAIISYGPELGKIAEAFRSGIVSNRIKSVAQYEDAGFSHDDAIAMTLDDVFAVRKWAQKLKMNHK